VTACLGLQEAQLRHCGSTLKENFPMKFVRDEPVRHRTHILQLLVDYSYVVSRTLLRNYDRTDISKTR
jgi:hypothetical protein